MDSQSKKMIPEFATSQTRARNEKKSKFEDGRAIYQEKLRLLRPESVVRRAQWIPETSRRKFVQRKLAAMLPRDDVAWIRIPFELLAQPKVLNRPAFF